MADRSKDWMAQAERDLESARAQRRDGFHEWSCFIAQQASEKAIKAVYQKLGSDAWGHSLRDLLEGLAPNMEVDQQVRKSALRLDAFYVPTRYPNGWPSGTPAQYITEEDADNAIRCSEQIIGFCKGVLRGLGGSQAQAESSGGARGA